MYNTDTGELVTSHIVLKQTYFVTKLPATRGASKPGLTESASMFGFYRIHRAIHLFVALRDNYIRRCFVNIFTAKRIAGLLILLYLPLDYLYYLFSLVFLQSKYVIVTEKCCLKFKFIG
jgi:hypothetical protein